MSDKKEKQATIQYSRWTLRILNNKQAQDAFSLSQGKHVLTSLKLIAIIWLLRSLFLLRRWFK